MIKETLQAIGEAIIKHALFILETKGKYPLDRSKSKLLKTMKVEVQQARNVKGQFEGFTPNAKLLIYAEKYAEWLDRGRPSVSEYSKIKRVPLDVLIAWVKKMRIRGRVRKGKRKGQFISTNSLAWAIQTSIYKNGIKGRHFIQPAFDEGQRLVDLYLDSQLLDDMTYELDRTFKKLS